MKILPSCSLHLDLISACVLPFFCILSKIAFFFMRKVCGAFRVAVKMLLMWNSKIEIDGGENTIVTTSILEVRNLVVLRVCSNQPKRYF